MLTICFLVPVPKKRELQTSENYRGSHLLQ